MKNQVIEVVFEHGVFRPLEIQNLCLLDGQRVRLIIETDEASIESGNAVKHSEDRPFSELPFFGMWRDRDNLSSSENEVRKGREQWQQRSERAD